VVLLVAIAVALAIGFLRGGSLANVAGLRIRYLPVLFAALLVQIAIFSQIAGTRDIIHRIGPWLYIATLFATLFVMLVNLHIPGMKVIALGAALNALVITANGGFMPSPESALERAGRLEYVRQEEAERASGEYVLSNSTIADDDTRLLVLGDIIPIPKRVPLSNVISIGDIVIAIGAIIAIVRVMQPRGAGRGTQAADKGSGVNQDSSSIVPPGS
jgi:hypothetical protein